jgi:polyisoprenoid-binding protein YceI
MIRLFSTLILSALVGFAFSPLNTKEVVSIDTDESVIEWKAYKVTGKHNGTVKIKNGNLEMENGELVGGSFDIDMTSITVDDLEGNSKAKLEGHLKSADFFNVEEFNQAKFVITRVISRGKPGDYKIEGDLTIKGITKPIKFNALMEDNVANATITIDRTEFNVRYGSGTFFENLGDKTIYDDFDLNIKLVI